MRARPATSPACALLPGLAQVMCAEFLYPCFLMLCFGFGNLCLWGCMLSTMLAPGLALHGQQGYFNRCVDWVRCPRA